MYRYLLLRWSLYKTNRVLHFIALDKAQKQEIKLDQDYARLKLYQARLANHKLIKVAAEKQHLKPPGADNTVMVERKK